MANRAILLLKKRFSVLLWGGLRQRLLTIGAIVVGLILAGTLLSIVLFDMSLGQGLWWAWTHLLDPGFVADDGEGRVRIIVGSLFAIMGLLVISGAFLTLLQEISTKLIEQIRKGRISSEIAGHSIIAGTGSGLRRFVEAVQAVGVGDQRELVVVVPDIAQLESARKICGDNPLYLAEQIWQEEGFERLRLAHAQRLLILENFGGNNGEMLRIVTRLSDKRAALNPVEEIKVYVEMNNRNLLPVLQASLRAFKQPQAKMEVNMINLVDTAARQALSYYPLEGRLNMASRVGQAVMIIWGWSSFADALFRQALKVAHYPNKPTRIVIVTPEAENLRQRVKEEMPGLTEGGYAAEILSLEYFTQIALPDLKSCEADSVTVAVCGNDADEVFARSVQAATTKLPGLLQVFAELPDGSGYRDLIETMNKKIIKKVIKPVGSHAEALELAEKLDAFAISAHKQYLRKREEKGKRERKNGEYANPSDYDWKDLDEVWRNSNRSPVDQAPIKLRILADLCGLERHEIDYDGRLKKTKGLEEMARSIVGRVNGKLSVPNAVLESLSAIEHDRWSGEKYADGWVFEKPGDKARKASEYLVPYKDLTDEIKGYDRDQVADQLSNILGFKNYTGGGNG